MSPSSVRVVLRAAASRAAASGGHPVAALFLSSLTVSLLSSLALSPRPGFAQELGPVATAPGYRYAERLSFSAGTAGGGLAYLPDGRLVTYETESGEVRIHGAGLPQPLAKFDPPVFGSFLVVAPGGESVIFAESTGGGLYRVPLAGGGAALADHIGYAFDLAFDADGRGFVSAPGLNGNNSIRLLDGDPAAESKEVVADLHGFSGPVATDPKGDLYYGTADPAATTGQSILRFRRDAVLAAVAGDPLTQEDGEVLADELGSMYALKYAGGPFVYSDLGFSIGGPAIYRIDFAADAVPSAVATFHSGDGLLSPTFLDYRPGTRPFAAGAGAAGGSIAFAFSDFHAINRVGEIVPELYFVRGRVNGDDAVDISDAVALLAWLFTGGAEPEVPEAADLNDDGELDLSDAVYLLDYLFKGGPEIPPPYPEPGPGA